MKLFRHALRTWPEQVVLPAFCVLAFCQQVVGKRGMGIRVIWMGGNDGPILFGRCIPVTHPAECVPQIATDLGIVWLFRQRLFIKRSHLVYVEIER